MQDQGANIANIFLADGAVEPGVLIGFNFEGFIFVIVDIIPISKV